MLMLLALPAMVLRIAFYALRGLADVLQGRERLRAERTVLINAPRDAVWRFLTADRTVFDGGLAATELRREPVPEDRELYLNRIRIGGQEIARVAMRELTRDEATGTVLVQCVPGHKLTHPPAFATDCLTEVKIETRPEGIALTLSEEQTVGAFKDRILVPVGVFGRAARIKRQCEKDAGKANRPAPSLDGGNSLGVSIVALLSFWYLVGWQDALLLVVVVALHEAGHAAAMRLVGMKVQGIYLVPFFGGAAVPKTAYQTQGHLGFVALMGAGFSLVPTFALAAAYGATGEPYLLRPLSWFALINAINLLPIYPLDGGLIVNALLGSLSRRLAWVWGWIGVLAGLGIALYLQDWLIGVPFLLFALQHYQGGGIMPDLKRLSFAGGAGLVLAFVATFALHVAAFAYAEDERSLISGADRTSAVSLRQQGPVSFNW
jgi:Zn-dependent protease